MDPAGEVGFVGKMGAKRCRKMKVERDVAKAAAAALEGNKKLSTQYAGVAEANPSNYVLLSVGGGGWGR